MKCYKCNCKLTDDRDTCPKCGADVKLYRKVVYTSNQYYNLGLTRARARDLTGAAECLKVSIQLYKKNIDARNLLGLVYYEMGEAALALKEWVISKNFRHRNNIADDYIRDLRDNRKSLDSADHSIHKYNQALECAKTGSRDMAVIQLKKVIAVNPRMIKAYQLLALLYMQDQKYDQASEVIEKCLAVDRGNPTALSYKRELQSHKAAKKKSIGVAGELEREEVIIPVRMRDYGSYLAAAAYVLLGFALALGVLYYVIMPGKEEQYKNNNKAEISSYEDKYAALNASISGLEKQVSELEEQKNAEVSQYQNSNDEATAKADAYSELLDTAQLFVDEKYNEVPDSFKALDANKISDEKYKTVYDSMRDQVEKRLTDRIYSQAVWAREQDNDRNKAIEYCEQIISIDPGYDSAYFYSGLCYQELQDNDAAVDRYTQYLEKFPNGSWAADIRGRMAALAPDVLASLSETPSTETAQQSSSAQESSSQENSSDESDSAEESAEQQESSSDENAASQSAADAQQPASDSSQAAPAPDSSQAASTQPSQG